MRSNVSLWRSNHIFGNATLNISGLDIRRNYIRGNFTSLHCHSDHHPERRFCGHFRWSLITDRYMYKRTIRRGDFGWWNYIEVSVARLRQL